MKCHSINHRSLAAFFAVFAIQSGIALAQSPTEKKIFGVNEPQEKAGDTVDLFVTFQEILKQQTMGQPAGQNIWTRAYSFSKTPTEKAPKAHIPGPTLQVNPGGLLSVTLKNQLDEADSPGLSKYEEIITTTGAAGGGPGGGDKDEVGPHIVFHEVNVPHNPENTNLHVHGLHVDPARDDVTIVVLPKGTSEEERASYSQPFKPESDPKPGDPGLTERDVSDRPVVIENYPYRYRIPEIHLPGTHWYHAHKHGSTALQTENGMAGAILLGQFTELDPLARYQDQIKDRVLLLQSLANYGVSQGTGERKTDKENEIFLSSATMSVNGEYQPTLQTVQAGSTERWRFVNATANHRSMAFFWLGKNITPPGASKPVYESVPIYAIAVDGVTLPKKVEITAANPILLAPGNRTDVLFHADANADPNTEYVLFRDVPNTGGTSDIIVQDAAGNVIDTSWLADGARLNIFLFNDSDKTPGGPFSKKLNYWGTTAGANQLTGDATSLPVVPLLKVVETTTATGSNLVDVALAVADQNGTPVPDPTDPSEGETGWQPFVHGGGGGSIAGGIVLKFKIGAAGTPGPKPEEITLANYSPVSMDNPPAYVSPVSDTDILQSRASVFDLSGVTISVPVTVPGDPGASVYKGIQQFTISGRVFALNDSIGSSNADSLVSRSVGAHLTAYLDDILPPKPDGDPNPLNFSDNQGKWFNEDSYVNPGYYHPLTKGQAKAGQDEVEAFSYQFGTITSGSDAPYPTYQQYPDLENVIGLPDVSVVNPNWKNGKGADWKPGLPVAQTAEEWVLINNSDLAHPFHIHINPFFVTEVGQLTRQGGKWDLNKIVWSENGVTQTGPSKGSPFDWVVGTWWDTILIPPRGYVKFRYWFNVPAQSDDNSSVTDNSNSARIWVYHCHILRHEDRGMMMVVETQQNTAEGKAGADADAARRAARKGVNLND